MPELPEVQTVVNDLIHAGLIGNTIRDAGVFWNKTIGNLYPNEFTAKITGQIITNIRRRAKYIIFDFESGMHLLIHLRMSGRLQLLPNSSRRDKHEHIILHLNDDRDVRFHDTRKFGRMTLTDNPSTILGKLGPEPLSDDFTITQFQKMLKTKNRQLKPLLLDQNFLAGLGNIYVDEALWKARLHPLKIASTLSSGKVKDLHQAIRNVLQQGIDNQGTSLGDGMSNFVSAERQRGNNAENLMVFRRTDKACPRCNTKIKRIVVGQRSTHICPKCQKY
ncbi:MAG: bifunctional DNA-formamidopyrimidine glycosylase/DNA-(apurinic or apyrimidinic site) lyase [Candidatus Marinimicrobia bacterium]|nr:bifunctional DNA-formamidopyrimidine glycosylase/DNA-(apurinic or apyrimidinic site) lyase [Candidatus Neomarinimicrobiota bacterium]